MTHIKSILALVAAALSTAAFASEARADAIETEAVTAANATVAATAAASTIGSLETVHHRSFHRAPDGLFYIHAAVNGTPLRFVIDTGATVVVLNGQDAARLGLHFESLTKSARMNTVGGPSAMKWTELERLEMAGKKLEGIAAAVVEQGLPVSLLGQNALSLLGTVTLKGNVLTID